MSSRGNDPNEPDGFDDRELIDAEFESMVSGLSLDESSPRTYLDDLDAIDDGDRFIPPDPGKTSLKKFFKDAKRAARLWRSRKDFDGGSSGDGAVI